MVHQGENFVLAITIAFLLFHIKSYSYLQNSKAVVPQIWPRGCCRCRSHSGTLRFVVHLVLHRLQFFESAIDTSVSVIE